MSRRSLVCRVAYPSRVLPREPAWLICADVPTRPYRARRAWRDTLTTVTPSSPREHRVAVERFAWKFVREMLTPYMFTATGDDRYMAYLFGLGGRWVGAACFRPSTNFYRDAPATWVLTWVWLDPSARGRDLLSRAWPQFERDLGTEFLLLGPLSAAMQGFVVARGIAPDRIVPDRLADLDGATS